MPESPPLVLAKLLSGSKDGDKLLRAAIAAGYDAAPEGTYRHWDTLRFLTPPYNATHEEWWASIKLARTSLYRFFGLKKNFGDEFFKFAMPECAQKRLHEIDRDASGRIALAEEVTNPASRDQYLVNSLMEEAITSSQLEGASTTRKVAKEMIRSGRAPRDTDERMILNNFRAMNRVRELVDQPLTADRIFELHRMLTDGTLEHPDAAGRFRTDIAEEDIEVRDRTDGQTLHKPPPAGELEWRMASLIEFANGDGGKSFVHPVVRSVLLHFWLAYDHPFVDGNGRTARALFYWSMLKHGYWLVEYVSISKILRKAPAKYSRSFLYSETDDNDATYFVLAQMAVIQQAINDLHLHLRKKMSETRELERLMRASVQHFNHRQLALLSHAQKHPNSEYTVEGHAMSHNISYESARLDMTGLEKKKLLVRHKIGKTLHFSAADGLASRLKKL